MKSEQFLKNLKFIKAKYEINKIQGKESRELQKLINIYETCRKTLTDRQKQVIEQLYINEKSVIDVAAIIGWSRSTIKRDIKRIEERLQGLIKDIEIDDSLLVR